ncbi:MAG: hypothetical protein P4M08_01720 [Oligoflexia bacterium]|nr:hypothetical protein [Oligoflexia bacterium]
MSPIRRRGSKLTPAEEIEQTKLKLVPYWIGSEPLIAVVNFEAGARAYPLSSAINDHPWLIVFLDTCSYSDRYTLELSREWQARYEQQKLSVLLVSRTPYSFARQGEWIARWARIQPNSFIATIDHDGLLAAAFSIRELPKILACHHGKIAVIQKEAELQNFFRSADPGLPLPPPSEPAPGNAVPATSIDISIGQAALQAAGITFRGHWTFDADRAVSVDRSAEIDLSFDVTPQTRMGIVAEAIHTIAGDESVPGSLTAGFALSLANGQTLGDEDLPIQPGQAANASLQPSELQKAGFSIREARLYRLLKSLPPTGRMITLRFSASPTLPIAVYGFRFA